MYKQLIYLVIDGFNTSILIIALWVTGIRRGLEDYSAEKDHTPLYNEHPLFCGLQICTLFFKKRFIILGKGGGGGGGGACWITWLYQPIKSSPPPTHIPKHYFFSQCRSECPVNRFDHCWRTTYPMDNLKQISHLLTFRIVERNC